MRAQLPFGPSSPTLSCLTQPANVLRIPVWQKFISPTLSHSPNHARRLTSFPLPTCLPTLFVVSIRISQSARIIWYKFSSHHIEEAASPLMQPLFFVFKYK